MYVQKINGVSVIDLQTIHNIMSSSKLSEHEKENFIRQHKTEIHEIFRKHLNGAEYKLIMKNRPLRKFRFIKNSATKRGDRILLAEALGINPIELDDYIEDIEKDITDFDTLEHIPKDKLEAIKTYLYRHGSKDDIVKILDYELKSSRDILQTLYRTLEYHKGGIADYFIRPVHRMSNKTMIKMCEIIDKNLRSAVASGSLSEEKYEETAHWALTQIYAIQNNSKLINAIKTYKELNA